MMLTCDHFQSFKSAYGLDSYELVCATFISETKPNLFQAFTTCFDCDGVNDGRRILACLQCTKFACFERHVDKHWTTQNHEIYVELSNGHILCRPCNSYVFDQEAEKIADKLHCGFRRSKAWRPNNEENILLKEHWKRVKLDSKSNLGIRGIVNLGNTCYMNSIAQALLHTPILRNYFFTDKHKCTRRGSCLHCLFSRMFQRYYTEGTGFISLHEILHRIWKDDPNIAGYGQKDAHEFFISVLNLLHQYSTPTGDSSQSQGTCIIDIVFLGKMQSDVVCLACLNISAKVETFWDISIDIPDPGVSLYECLQHFTRPESLGSQQRINCNACKSYQECTKQLTFSVLPLVVVIHLKRFEKVDGHLRKKELFVPFPMDLNMSPYLSGYRNTEKEGKIKLDDADNRYTLYAVVVHIGSLTDSGHYLTYVRKTNQGWYKCSDMNVVPVTVEEVMASQWYLLFYHKSMLYYN